MQRWLLTMSNTTVDTILEFLKNKKIVAIVVVVAIVLIATGQVLDAVGKIWSFMQNISKQPPSKEIHIDHETSGKGTSQEKTSTISAEMKFVVAATGEAQFRSISAALKAGITNITVAPGTYKECLNITRSGVTIQGTGRRSTIIDGGTSGPALTLNASRFRAENLSFRTTPGAGKSNGAIYIGETSPVEEFELIDIEVAESDNISVLVGVKFPCHHGVIKSSWIGGADRDGIVIDSNSYRIDVTENVVCNNGELAVNMRPGTHHCRIFFNEISGGSKAISDSGEENEIRDNIFLPDTYKVRTP